MVRSNGGEISRLIRERKVFPCYFGSALKNIGVKEFLAGLECYAKERSYPEEFGAKVYKIARDPQGNRLTYLKVTGGVLKVRDLIRYQDVEEKVSQIRIYSGEKYDAVQEVRAGRVCAVTGLTKTYPGEGLGAELHRKAGADSGFKLSADTPGRMRYPRNAAQASPAGGRRSGASYRVE